MKKIIIGAVIGALVVLGIALVVGKQSVLLSGDTNFDSIDVTDGYKVDSTTVIDGSGNVDAPITTTTITTTATSTLGANLVVTQSNTATSSVQVQCVQATATSTETPIRLTFGTIATSSPSYEGGNSQGHVLWVYGKCPRI